MSNTVLPAFRSTGGKACPEVGPSAFSGCCTVQGHGWRRCSGSGFQLQGGQCQPLIHEKVRRQTGVQPAAFQSRPEDKRRVFSDDNLAGINDVSAVIRRAGRQVGPQNRRVGQGRCVRCAGLGHPDRTGTFRKRGLSRSAGYALVLEVRAGAGPDPMAKTCSTPVSSARRTGRTGLFPRPSRRRKTGSTPARRAGMIVAARRTAERSLAYEEHPTAPFPACQAKPEPGRGVFGGYGQAGGRGRIRPPRPTRVLS